MNQLTLDPQNWNEMKSLGHKMVDDMMDYLSGLRRDRPAWKQVPENSAAAINHLLPTKPEGFEATYDSFKEHVLPYPNGNIHPRFWGWVQGTGTPFAMLADMLASGMNPHMAGFNQSPAIVEETVMDWLKEMMGFAKDSTGLLTSGGTMANLIGLAVARHDQAAFDFRKEGFQGLAGKKSAFRSEASYLKPTGRGVCAGPLKFADLGIELTRGFKALKVWMSIKAHGADIFGQLIGQNISQCQYLAQLIEKSESLELLAPVNMNVVCFRYQSSGLDDKQLDLINNELLLRLQETGVAVPSGTRIHGKYALRVANVNHRSMLEDFDLLILEAERIGAKIVQEFGDRHD